MSIYDFRIKHSNKKQMYLILFINLHCDISIYFYLLSVVF